MINKKKHTCRKEVKIKQTYLLKRIGYPRKGITKTLHNQENRKTVYILCIIVIYWFRICLLERPCSLSSISSTASCILHLAHSLRSRRCFAVLREPSPLCLNSPLSNAITEEHLCSLNSLRHFAVF